MKKIAVGVIAILGLTLLQPVYAQDKKTLVIIDTAIDTTRPEFQGKIIHEVCLMEELRCPNGKSFQEGSGSATLPVSQIYSNGWDHGTRIAQLAVKTNSDMNIVFIRIFPMDRNGRVAHNAANTNSTVKQAIDWVIANKTKYNVVAVSASIGQRPRTSTANYCKMDRWDNNFKSSILALQNIGVAAVFASGNDRDKTRINYPSCLNEVISVASSTIDGYSEPYNNDAPELDFYALGRHQLSDVMVSGTSAATVAFASYWVKVYQGNYSATYNYIKSIATTSKDTNKINSVVDILK
jgi:hypothetical protein